MGLYYEVVKQKLPCFSPFQETLHVFESSAGVCRTASFSFHKIFSHLLCRPFFLILLNNLQQRIFRSHRFPGHMQDLSYCSHPASIHTSTFPHLPAVILWLTAFLSRSASLGVRVIAVLSVQTGQIMGNVLPKKRLISASRSMPWSRWKAISRHLRSPLHRWMTGKGSGILWRSALVWWSLGTKAIPEKPFLMTCAGKGYAWCHWSLLIIKITGPQKYGGWSSAFAEG